jgi:hypothetical protein
MTRIYWKSTWANARVRVEGINYLPKRPVVWRGNVWMDFVRGGVIERDAREWKAGSPITQKEGQAILKMMLSDLLEENGNDAVAAGFEMRSP